MDQNTRFRQKLLDAMKEQGLKAAALSKMAGLNPRAVKDIEENRVVSPKISTVFALAKALNCDPGQMLGLSSHKQIRADLVDYLSQYSADDQAQLLSALRILGKTPRDEP